MVLQMQPGGYQKHWENLFSENTVKSRLTLKKWESAQEMRQWIIFHQRNEAGKVMLGSELDEKV